MSVLKTDIALQRTGFALEIDCEIDTQITGIFGPSGAGKTTFLHALAGLETPDRGSIQIADRVVFHSQKHINLPPEKRNVGIVFQEGRLFPHLSVIQNLKYGIKQKANIADFSAITELLRITDILNSKVSKISGGQGQRVAIGRALLSNPDILVLDEPFSALDKNLRQHIILLLKPLISKFKIPVLVISHDLSDLLMLSDTLMIIKDGRCIGQGNYYDLIGKNEVTEALNNSGLINSVELTIKYIDGDKGLIILNHGDQQIYAESVLSEEKFIEDKKVSIILRPEDVTLAAHKIKDISIQNQLEGKIEKLITTRNRVLCVIDHGFKLISEVSLATKHKMDLKEGKKIWSLFKAAAIKLSAPGFVNSNDL
jgi:molybdate transport system ATP-binding protein